MKFRFIKIISILISFFFLTGFLPFISILGPSLTAFTSGNVYKAGAQYMINKSIKDTTGKSSLTYVRDKIDEHVIFPNKYDFMWLNQSSAFEHKAAHNGGRRRVLSFEYKVYGLNN